MTIIHLHKFNVWVHQPFRTILPLFIASIDVTNAYKCFRSCIKVSATTIPVHNANNPTGAKQKRCKSYLQKTDHTQARTEQTTNGLVQ